MGLFVPSQICLNIQILNSNSDGPLFAFSLFTPTIINEVRTDSLVRCCFTHWVVCFVPYIVRYASLQFRTTV